MIYHLKINDIEQSFEFLLMPRLVCSHATYQLSHYLKKFFSAHNLMRSICFTFLLENLVMEASFLQFQSLEYKDAILVKHSISFFFPFSDLSGFSISNLKFELDLNVLFPMSQCDYSKMEFQDIL